jgi:hypothetical protein
MRTLITSILLTLGLASAAQASEDVRADELTGYEQVKSITAFGGLHSWSVIDNDTLIVWANAFRPYLVELKYPSHDLRFTNAIGVTQFGSQIHARFDSVQVRGLRYPIGAIYKLSREEARQLTRS